MKRLFSSWWMAAVAALLLAAPAAKLQAQGAGDPKPVAVVSIAPIDKLLADVDYLAEAAGAADALALIKLPITAYTEGLDTTKPAGGYVVMEGETPISVGFVPTKDLDKVLATLSDTVGAARDAGDGVKEVGGMFVKLSGGYTFIAQDPEHLKKLPKDPAAMLGTLAKTYSLAAKFNAQNVPKDLKAKLIEQMKLGFEAAASGGGDPDDVAAREKTGRDAIKQIERLMNEANEITIGWMVDSIGKTTAVEFVFTAVDGTTLAKEMATLKDAKTNFAGFLMENAAMTFNFAGKMTDKEQIAQQVQLLDGFRDQLNKEIENDGDAEDVAALKDLTKTVFDVLKATVNEGVSDGGAVVVTEANSLTFVAGLHVVDAPKLEAALKKAVAFAKMKSPEELEKVTIKFDASKYGDLRFHTIKIPVPDDDAKKVFGENLDIIIAVSDKTVYVAGGSKADATLKKVVDDSAKQAGKSVSPVQMTISLEPIIRFIDSVEPNPVTGKLAEVAKAVKGNDHIKLDVTAIPNGERMRFAIEEGILKLIKEGAQAAAGAGAAPGAF